jgi:hypothetical protein
MNLVYTEITDDSFNNVAGQQPETIRILNSHKAYLLLDKVKQEAFENAFKYSTCPSSELLIAFLRDGKLKPE